MNLIIFGSSGHAKVIVDIVEKQGCHKIAGFIDSSRKESLLGYPMLGSEVTPRLVSEYDLAGIIIAVGDNSVRAKLAGNVSGLSFPAAIHPSAQIGRDSVIGEGTVIMPGTVIGPCCSVGRFCIVNTSASLDHDSAMGDFSSLAPGVSTGGNCKIGEFSAISIGAVLKHGITVSEHSIVGAGAVVVKDLEPFSVAYGVPARRIRSRQAGERYL